MRTCFPLDGGETQKDSTRKCCLSTLLHLWTRCPEASRDIPFRSTNGAAAPGEVWAVARQTGPRRAAPLVLLYAVFATHPQRGEYSRPPVAPAVIAPQYRFPRGEGWRIPQGSPASLWEGVSKFHYPPRCRRARLARARSKVRADRSARFLHLLKRAVLAARLLSLFTQVLCLEYCVFSCSQCISPPYLSGGFWPISGTPQ